MYIKKEEEKKYSTDALKYLAEFLNTFCSTFSFLTAHKIFLSENICVILWIDVRRIPLYFQYT